MSEVSSGSRTGVRNDGSGGVTGEARSGSSAAAVLQELRAGFETPPGDSRIMMRWWWFGPFVEEAELRRELESMQRAGIGGVEVAFVYPLASPPAADDGFLSDRFLEHLTFAAATARELGLRFDVTLGSGWSFGGGHIPPELAARRLHWDRREISQEALSIPVPGGWPGDTFLGAYLGSGALTEPPASYEPLPVRNGRIEIPAGRGPRTVLLAVSRSTGQNVKRAAAGAEGPVLDHYSRSAAELHLSAVAEKLISAVPAGTVTAVFCDSLEVYGADWTPDMFEEFAARRGYDLRPLLHQLSGEPTESSAGLRADFYQTLSELYEENFVDVLRAWARAHGLLFRLQSYGAPPATLSSYRRADLIEGEGWGWKSLPQTRWAASAAHLYGRPVVSSETWTWVHSPSFRANPLDLKGEAHEHFLVGVNQLIGHGWPYSPPDAEAPGWAFYASGALSDANPWWPAMRPLARYLERLSWLLRQGSPVADVGLYAPTTDAYLQFDPDSHAYLNLWLNTKDRIGPGIPAAILDHGSNFDLFDDTSLGVLDPGTYRAIVLPYVERLPADTVQWLDKYAELGGTVAAVGGAPRNGWTVLADAAALAGFLDGAVERDWATSPRLPEIGAVHRRVADLDVYFVANTSASAQSFTFLPRTAGTSYEQWDALSGGIRRRGPLGGGIGLQLEPYEATVIVAGPADALDGFSGVGEAAPAAAAESIALDGPWSLSYSDGTRPEERAEEQVVLPHRWEESPERNDYSGSAGYSTHFFLPESSSDTAVVLDFGAGMPQPDRAAGEGGIRANSYRADLTSPIGEVAEVTVNGTACGCVWAPPYRVDITAAVVPGKNILSVRVFNTAVNSLRANTELAETVERATAAYGLRFRMQDYDLVEQPTHSGLRTVPRILQTRTTADRRSLP